METKFYTAKYDRVFKAIFCTEENKHMMKKLLESVLEKSITELTFLNNELPVKNTKERVKTVDVLVLVDDEFIHIELNANNYSFLHTRNFIYFSTIYGKKTNRGDEYDYKTKFIHIDFSYGLNSKKDDVTKYYVMNKNGIKYIDNIEIIEFNMDSLKKYCYTKSSEEYNKYKHLIMLDLDKTELNDIEGDEFMNEYKEKVESLNEDLTFTSAISYEDDQRMILNTERKISFEEGMEKGQEESKINIIKSMYDKEFSLEQIADIINISVDEVRNILEFK